MASGMYHYVITLQWLLPGGGMGSRSSDGLYKVSNGETRDHAYRAILDHTLRSLGVSGASTTHFSLEPNDL